MTRFSTSSCTVTRVPGCTRTSVSRRLIAIRVRPHRTNNAAANGNDDEADGDDLQAGRTHDPCADPHREAGTDDADAPARRHQGLSATGTAHLGQDLAHHDVGRCARP